MNDELSKHPLVKRSEKFARIDECRHDQTRQRRLERSFLSTDWRNENGDSFDYGDNGLAVRIIVWRLDSGWRKIRRDELFQKALDRLGKKKQLKNTLIAIRLFRVREAIVKKLNIPLSVYNKRVFRLGEIFNVKLEDFNGENA